MADGVENTTYFVTTETDQGRVSKWVLTILEVENSQQTAFSAALVDHLCRAGLPVPALARDRDDNAIHCIAGKKALLAHRIVGLHPGSDAQKVSVIHCAAIGEFLGKMHRGSAGFHLQHANPYGLSWAESAMAKLASVLPSGDLALVREQLSRQRLLREQVSGMPVGAIHADLFRDNTLFNGETLSAVIDFQSACTDWFLLDVAIAVNDWASTGEGEIDTALASALLNAYRQQRPFIEREHQLWQDVLCFAATQFWLSRLWTNQYAHAELTGRCGKDPQQYARILRCRVARVTPLPQ